MTETGRFARLAAGVLAAALAAAGPAAAGVVGATYLGPSAYLGTDDSPFATKEPAFCVEDFEDGNLNVPGATGDGAVVTPGGNIDSVDGDDGEIDGSGNGGHSYFSGNGAAGITIEFDAQRTNGLPTQVGIVWTDGGFPSVVTFEAFDAEGNSFGPFAGAPHADDSNLGETAEDRFYGVTTTGAGISKIRVSNTSGGIEVDHLQLNRCVLCGDAVSDLRIAAADALVALKTSVGTASCQTCVCDTNTSGSVTATDALSILKKSVGLPVTLACPACN